MGNTIREFVLLTLLLGLFLGRTTSQPSHGQFSHYSPPGGFPGGGSEGMGYPAGPGPRPHPPPNGRTSSGSGSRGSWGPLESQLASENLDGTYEGDLHGGSESARRQGPDPNEDQPSDSAWDKSDQEPRSYYHDYSQSFPDPGSGTGLESTFHGGNDQQIGKGDNDARGSDASDAIGGTKSGSSQSGVQSGESVKSHTLRHNISVDATENESDDDFNYVGMYITVAVFITFMVTLVAIALIRGPKGPFKTKRSEDEIARRDILLSNAAGSGNGDVIMLEEGNLSGGGGGSAEDAARTDAQWERQPLKEERDVVPTAAAEPPVTTANETTAITVDDRASQDGGV